MNRNGLLRLLFLSFLLLSGCWNRTELNELGITAATGFDKEGKEWVMSYQVIVPSVMAIGQGGAGSGGKSKPNVHVFTNKGASIREAADMSYMENARRLYFAHTDVLVLGIDAAKEGIDEVLDLYFRNNDARETVLVTITDGKASDILKKLIPAESLPGTALSEMIRKESAFSSRLPSIKVYQLAQRITSDSAAAGVPEIKFTGNIKGEMESLDDEKRTSAPGKLVLNRLGVFRGDRFIGWLNRRESFGVSWLTDQVKGSTIAFSSDSKSGKPNSIRITQAKTKVTPEKAGNRFKMRIEVKLSGALLEAGTNQDLMKHENIYKLVQDLAKEVTDIMNIGWKASKRIGVDLPGFADKIHRKYPKDWKKMKETWTEDFKTVELDVQVKAKILRPGLLKKAFRTNHEGSSKAGK